MKYTLRPYQERTIEELFAWFMANLTGNPIIDACVGAGKSLIIAELCRRIIEQYPNQRILMAVASRELAAQNYEKLKEIYPEGDMGLYSAGLGKKNPHAKIVFATIGSVYNKAMHTGAFNLCFIDECHNVSRKETGMYRQMISDYQKLNPKFRVIGFTGTPFRGNGIWLTEGKEAIFNAIASKVGMRELLELGFLSPLVLSNTRTKTDISGVKINSATGDYNINELAKAIDRDEVTSAIVDEIIEKGHDRKAWLVFGVDVAHCEHLHEALKKRGISGGIVHGAMPTGQRDFIINQYKTGRIRYLVNCMVLTVGFDAPRTDLIALARNTKSPVLYVQVGGRGMRLHPDKANCLWLDFTDTTETLGAIDQVQGRKEVIKKKESSGSASKKCPSCGAINQPTARFCACGFEFVVERNVSINAQSSDAPILSTGVNPNLMEVFNWSAAIHQKYEALDTLRVSYFPLNAGNLTRAVAEYICFNHQGFPRRKAENWWAKMGGLLPFPSSTAEAKARFHELTKPTAITVIKNGKYTEIQGHVTSTSNANQLPNPAPKAGTNYFSQAVFGNT